jgi:hypothetical protein
MHFMPPLFIFAGKNIMEWILNGAPPTIGQFSESFDTHASTLVMAGLTSSSHTR